MDILEASRTGNLDRVRELLDSGVDIETKDEYNHTPLYLAVSNQDVEIVKLLIKRGADVNAHGFDYWSVFDVANYRVNDEIINLLIWTGKISPENIESSLFFKKLGVTEKVEYAIRDNNLERVRQLLDIIPINYNRVIAVAFEDNQNIDIIRLLLERGADPNYVDLDDGNTVLHKMLINQINRIDIADLLIQNGFDINILNDRGESIISLAISNNMIDMVRLLLNSGANAESNWTSALENHPEIFDLLMDPRYKKPEPVEPAPNPEENSRVATTICSICQELKNYNITNLDSPYVIHSLTCGHTYHNVCITRWFKTRRDAGSPVRCPTCNAGVKRHFKVFLGGSNYYKYQKYLNKNIK
jgi:ankyrin repeat protein